MKPAIWEWHGLQRLRDLRVVNSINIKYGEDKRPLWLQNHGVRILDLFLVFGFLEIVAIDEGGWRLKSVS